MPGNRGPSVSHELTEGFFFSPLARVWWFWVVSGPSRAHLRAHHPPPRVLHSRSLSIALYTVWRRTVRFFDNFYVDLHHFAGNLAVATSQREIRQACRDVQAAIEGKGARSPILAEGHAGPRMRNVRGLSLYFPPFRDPSVFYRELDFARRTRWADFLEAYLGDGR